MVHFREVQQFRQPWLWIILIVPLAPVAWGAYAQLVRGSPFGNHPISDRGLAALILILAALPLWMYGIALITEVRDDEIDLRFRLLFSHRRIPIRDVRSCEAVTYSPIREYGGWGIRFGRGGRAYNVSGDRGVQLELSDGKRLLIGSQQAEELAHAIAARQAVLRGA